MPRIFRPGLPITCITAKRWLEGRERYSKSEPDPTMKSLPASLSIVNFGRMLTTKQVIYILDINKHKRNSAMFTYPFRPPQPE